MEIAAIIEDPRGSTVRHHWDPGQERWTAKPHPRTAEPWPASYGYLPGTWNPADEDDLDVLVLARDPLETGSQVTIRAVGLLRRPDGDDKILGVLVGDTAYGHIERLQDVPDAEIAAIEGWFSTWSEVGEWHDETVARGRIEEARAHAR